MHSLIWRYADYARYAGAACGQTKKRPAHRNRSVNAVMADPKGDKLYVNLSASQVRRRLKGVGYGVRKVHSAGRNLAVVIHTAVGHNLRALQAIFADVGSAVTERELLEIVEHRSQRESGLVPMQEPLVHDNAPREPPPSNEPRLERGS